MRERVCAGRATVAALVLVAVIAGSFVPLARGAVYDYQARKLLTSTAIASGAYAVSGGKQYGVRTVPGQMFTEFRVTVWNGTDSYTDLGRGWVTDALGQSFAGSTSTGATLWTTPTTPINLHPPGPINGSQIEGLAPGVQVGHVGSFPARAMLWRGSAASALNLHPAGTTYASSSATAAGGDQQVGSVYTGGTNPLRAALWRGTAASFVNLHPSGYVESVASGVSRGRQVGTGVVSGRLGRGEYHALLWRGTAASAVRLTPPGYSTSAAYAMVGDWVVGEATHPTTGFHPIMWDLSTNPPTVIDLKPAMDAAGFIATPSNISSSGQIVGVTRMTPDPTVPGGQYHAAVLWEPSTRRMPGDANLDGNVTFADFQLLERNLGSNDSYWKLGDFNDDRETTFADFLLLRANFGKSVAAPSITVPASDRAALEAFYAAHVPEPGTAAALALIVATLLRRPYRR